MLCINSYGYLATPFINDGEIDYYESAEEIESSEEEIFINQYDYENYCIMIRRKNDYGMKELERRSDFYRKMYEKIDIVLRNCGFDINYDNVLAIIHQFKRGSKMKIYELDEHFHEKCNHCGTMKNISYVARISRNGRKRDLLVGSYCIQRLEKLYNVFHILYKTTRPSERKFIKLRNAMTELLEIQKIFRR